MLGVDIGSAGRRILDMVWLELTTRCNLACTHCYADAGADRPLAGDMTLAHWCAAIDEARDLGASQFQLIGGEPTLHPHFRTLLDHIAKADPSVLEVYTNATRLSADLVGCLKHSGARVAASFYADAPAVHDAVTLRPGSWQRTVAGIERALAADLPVRIGIIATAANRTRVDATVAFLQRLGVRDIGIDGERGVGRGGCRDGAASGEDFTQLCGRCGSARLCVTATGDIHPCVFSRRTPLGDVRRGGLRAALASHALRRFCTSMQQARRLRIADGVGFCNPGPCHPSNPCPPSGPQPDVERQRPAEAV